MLWRTGIQTLGGGARWQGLVFLRHHKDGFGIGRKLQRETHCCSLLQGWRIVAVVRLIGTGMEEKGTTVFSLLQPSSFPITFWQPLLTETDRSQVTSWKWGLQSFSSSTAKLSLKLRDQCLISSTFCPFNYLTSFQILLHIFQLPYNCNNFMLPPNKMQPLPYKKKKKTKTCSKPLLNMRRKRRNLLVEKYF